MYYRTYALYFVEFLHDWNKVATVYSRSHIIQHFFVTENIRWITLVNTVNKVNKECVSTWRNQCINWNNFWLEGCYIYRKSRYVAENECQWAEAKADPGRGAANTCRPTYKFFEKWLWQELASTPLWSRHPFPWVQILLLVFRLKTLMWWPHVYKFRKIHSKSVDLMWIQWIQSQKSVDFKICICRFLSWNPWISLESVDFNGIISLKSTVISQTWTGKHRITKDHLPRKVTPYILTSLVTTLDIGFSRLHEVGVPS